MTPETKTRFFAMGKLVLVVTGLVIIIYGAYKAIELVVQNVKHDCKDGSSYNDKRDRCEPKCDGEGQQYDVAQNACDCVDGYTKQADGTCVAGGNCKDGWDRCPSDGGVCYDPSNAECINGSVCCSACVIPLRTASVQTTLTDTPPHVFSYQKGQNATLHNGDEVTIDPKPKYNGKDDTTARYYVVNSNDRGVSVAASMESGATVLDFDASTSVYTLKLVGTKPTCCPKGQIYNALQKKCLEKCGGGVDVCPQQTSGCCSTDAPKCDPNGECCTEEDMAADGTCCKDGVPCNGICCRGQQGAAACCGSASGGCGTGSKEAGKGAICGAECVINGQKMVCPANATCATYIDKDGTEKGACIDSTVYNNWDDQNPTYSPAEINGKPTCMDSEGKVHYCTATADGAAGMTYKTTYNFKSAEHKDKVTDIDCAAKAGTVDVYKSVWDPNAGENGQCTAYSHCAYKDEGGNWEPHIPLCLTDPKATDTVCPLHSDDIGKCCQREATKNSSGDTVYSGIVVMAPDGKAAGVRPSDAPDCAMCSGHGSYASGTCTCTTTNTPGWKNSPYTGDFCEKVDAHCTDWMGADGSHSGGMCPHMSATPASWGGGMPDFSGLDHISMPGTVSPTFVGVPGVANPSGCPADGAHLRQYTGGDNMIYDINYNWRTSVESTDPIKCQADRANVICVQGDIPEHDNPPNCSVGWNPSDPYANFGSGFTTRCSAPNTSAGCNSCAYNGVAGCQAPGNFVFDELNSIYKEDGNSGGQQNTVYATAPNYGEIGGKFCSIGASATPPYHQSGATVDTSNAAACPCSAQSTFSGGDGGEYSVVCPSH